MRRSAITDDDTRVTEVVAGYRLLATELATMWGDLASSIATKMDDDEYDGKAMVDVWAETVRLSAHSSYLMWNEAVEAAATLSFRPGERYMAHSDPFQSPLPSATLRVDGPLVGQQSKGTLIARVDQPQLADGETTFGLHADATDCEADTYKGTVLASLGDKTLPVKVFIVVE
jgi:hypothetical protein